MQESIDKLLKGCGSEQALQEKIATLTLERDVAMNNAVVNLHQYENLQKDNIKLAEEFNKLKKIQGSSETAPIIQKLKQQIREKDDTIAVQQQEINNTCAAQDKATAELTALQTEHNRLRKEHTAQKYELQTANDTIDMLKSQDTKVQSLIKMLSDEVQSKQNSFNDLSKAHTDLQT